MNVQTIPVALIDPPLFNSRLPENLGTKEELTSLGNSLKVKQLAPIGVVALNGGSRFRLVDGSRRLAAAKLVGMETIAADVDAAATDADEIVQNGIENMQRRDLTTFEQARYCAKLRELKLSGKEAAAKLGMSPMYLSNLAICYERLPDDIKTAWQKGEPATDINFLRSIVTKEVDGKKVDATHDDMRALYNERVQSLTAVDGEEEEEDEEEDDDETPAAEKAGAPAPKKFTVYKERYKALLKALRSVRASQMTIDACRYLVGDIEKIRGVPIGDSQAPTKKTKKEDK